jgi:hypothetical protein
MGSLQSKLVDLAEAFLRERLELLLFLFFFGFFGDGEMAENGKMIRSMVEGNIQMLKAMCMMESGKMVSGW